MTGEPVRDRPGPEEALALARRLAALEEGAIRARAAARHLEALEPTHAVLLPEEYFDLWRDGYLELVEQR